MTETPKAAERVLLDLARGISGFPDDVLDEFVADAVSELRAADLLRTPGGPSDGPNQNETKSGQEFCFTEAQVLAAAKAIADCHNPGMFEKYPENWRVEARAALVAAAGAAPQAERDDSPTPGNHAPVLPSSTVDEALRFCTCSHWLEAHHERKCLEHHCACVNFQPVLQIDEDALAGVIWQEQSDRVRDGYVIHTRETARSTARAVAEWLKG